MRTYHHDGLTFEVLEGGPQDGEVVVLLHGFPQDAGSYDEVASRLQAAGLRTLAPNQRGYSPGAQPRQVAAYRLDRLLADVTALLDDVGADRAHVVGHDWGGAVAWALAQAHPERVASLVVLSTPHPGALQRSLLRSAQGLRSWYFLAFQIPRLPERALARAVRRGGLSRTGVPAEHARRYAARFGQPAALRGPINWYRAAVRSVVRRTRTERGGPTVLGASTRRVGGVPTTYVWGNRDTYLGRVAAEGTEDFVDADYRFVEADAGHWLPENQPDLVAREVLGRARPATLTGRA